MRDMIKPGAVLCCITLIAALCLGFVYNITKEPIRIQKAQTTAAAMQKLLPSADSFEPMDLSGELADGSTLSEVTVGIGGGARVGYVISVAPKGYSGSIEMLVGINQDGGIEGVEIVKQTETPGLGANCQKPEFTGQYAGKSQLLTVSKSPSSGEQEIQALTSATITSVAVTDGVNEALSYFQNYLR